MDSGEPTETDTFHFACKWIAFSVTFQKELFALFFVAIHIASNRMTKYLFPCLNAATSIRSTCISSSGIRFAGMRAPSFSFCLADDTSSAPGLEWKLSSEAMNEVYSVPTRSHSLTDLPIVLTHSNPKGVVHLRQDCRYAGDIREKRWSLLYWGEAISNPARWAHRLHLFHCLCPLVCMPFATLITATVYFQDCHWSLCVSHHKVFSFLYPSVCMIICNFCL